MGIAHKHVTKIATNEATPAIRRLIYREDGKCFPIESARPKSKVTKKTKPTTVILTRKIIFIVVL